MRLTETEKKCLILAFDRSTPEGEMIAAAGRLVRLLRKRYRDGYEVLGDLAPKAAKRSIEDIRRDRETRQAAWLRRRATFGAVTLRFGKHRGKPLSNIPADYLLWVLRNCSRLKPALREAIEGYLRTCRCEDDGRSSVSRRFIPKHLAARVGHPATPLQCRSETRLSNAVRFPPGPVPWSVHGG